jgi:hypothetical protein
MKGRRYVILNKNGIKKKFALHDLIEDAFPWCSKCNLQNAIFWMLK